MFRNASRWKLDPGQAVPPVTLRWVVTRAGEMPQVLVRNRVSLRSEAICLGVGLDLVKSPTRQIPMPCSL